MGLFVPSVATGFRPKASNQPDPFAEFAGVVYSFSILRERILRLKIRSRKSFIITEAWPALCQPFYSQFANLTGRIVPQT